MLDYFYQALLFLNNIYAHKINQTVVFPAYIMQQLSILTKLNA